MLRHQFLNDVKLLPIHNPKQLELLRAAYTPDHWEKICEGSDSKDSLDEAWYANRGTHTPSYSLVPSMFVSRVLHGTVMGLASVCCGVIWK